MLKIDQNNSLSLNKSERFWTKTLALSFCLALLIHFAGLSLFRIRPLSCPQSDRIFPPISVQMDAPLMTDQNIIAAAQDDPLPNLRLPARPKQTPIIPLLSAHFPPPPVLWGFTNEKYSLELPDLIEEGPKQIHMQLLGALAHRKIISHDIEIEIPKEPETRHYSVTVDDLSGKVIWINPVDPISTAISSLRFDIKKNGSISKGELEVYFE